MAKILIAASLILGLASAPAAGRAQGASVTIAVEGVRTTQGSVRADICTRETFLKEECPYSGAAPAQVGTTLVIIPGVPPGVYAVQAYHDTNDNLRVDQNIIGIPKEGLGFSNDAPLGVHGPSFDKAAIVHGDAPQNVRLKLRHFLRP